MKRFKSQGQIQRAKVPQCWSWN